MDQTTGTPIQGIPDLYRRIISGTYDNKPPCPTIIGPGTKAARDTYLRENQRLEEQYKNDVMESIGMKGHPQTDEIYKKACTGTFDLIDIANEMIRNAAKLKGN